MLQNSLLITKNTKNSSYIKKALGNNVSDDESLMIDLSQQTFRIPDLFSFRVIEVTADQIARPDLISMDLYDTDIYGDLLCKLNGISDPFTLNEGQRLVVPAESNLNDFFTNDNYSDDEETSTKPAAKQRKSKRKANEAVVGDTRFKIDAKKRVVIY